MTAPAAHSPPASSAAARPAANRRHLLGIEGMTRFEIKALLDSAEDYITLNNAAVKKTDRLKGRTQINLFLEKSTRTQSSFELAGKRLGADVINFSAASSSLSKGESLADTIQTLNAMHPDLLVVRHGSAGAPQLIADLADCAVVNAGDGQREHPTQALLDALSIRRAFGGLESLVVAICGDILHSRVARSNILLLSAMGAEVRLVAPASLMPPQADRLTPFVFEDLGAGLDGADVVMALRLQNERMVGGFVPSAREYFVRFGITEAALKDAKPDVKVLHPGPMNRGVEIASEIADDPERCLVLDQVEMGVAARMAVLDALAYSQGETGLHV